MQNQNTFADMTCARYHCIVQHDVCSILYVHGYTQQKGAIALLYLPSLLPTPEVLGGNSVFGWETGREHFQVFWPWDSLNFSG